MTASDRRNGKNLLLRLRSYWRQQKRLRQVLKIAVTNGVVQTIKYARQRENEKELAIALRITLEQCGGIFIKFGQVLSTRKELFSPIFIDELEKLQHNVKPLSSEQVTRILEDSLPKPMNEIFASFQMEPIAAASIGQVHKARLKNFDEVVVKLLRPEVKGIMRDDLDILEEFANWLSNKSTWAESLGFRELAKGFGDGLREEIHLDIEARNTLQVTNALTKSDYKVKIPKIYTEYCNENIIVMEYVRGKALQMLRLNLIDLKMIVGSLRGLFYVLSLNRCLFRVYFMQIHIREIFRLMRRMAHRSFLILGLLAVWELHNKRA